MAKAIEVTLDCSECGDIFSVELPSLCQRCRPLKDNELPQINCSQCDRSMKKSEQFYCENCFSYQCQEQNRVTDDYQSIIDELQSKLLLIELAKVSVAESLYKKEKLINEMENRILDLNKQLNEVHNNIPG